MPNNNSKIVWEGPSRLNGEPLVVIITGLTRTSNNFKTGPMLQTWILPKSGRANSVDTNCGDCKLRDGACYVNWGQAPYMVQTAYKNDAYSDLQFEDLRKLIKPALRLGAAGDPTAVCHDVWVSLLQGVSNWTGYTHQWRKLHNHHYKFTLMASVDTPQEQREAAAMGWRTFRIRLPDEPVHEDEVVCPASEEAGKKTQCFQCNLCAGTSTTVKNVVIQVHGSRPKVNAYKRLRGIPVTTK